MNLPRLSPAAEKLMAAAAEESARSADRYLGVEHLLIGLASTSEPHSPFSEGLAAQGFDLARLETMLRARAGGSQAPTRAGGEELAFTPRFHEVLNLAGRIAARAGHGRVEPSHILEAILHEGQSVPVRYLRSCGVKVAELQAALADRQGSTRGADRAGDAASSTTPLLNRFGRDLTALARAGALSPVIGREKEMDLLAQVLLRRNKNNPVLVGEAGVGKTAVVEGFARMLVSPACPTPLRNRRVVELSVGTLVAGTKYRGEFEERLLGIVEESARHDELILFLDEIHS